MNRKLFKNNLDYHLFLYERLSDQISSIQKIVKENSIDSFEAMMGNETIRDVLLLKFIIIQRTLKKPSSYILEERYKINLKIFSWLDADYFDHHGIIHYDYVWSLLQDIKQLKKQIARIKKYNDEPLTSYGDDLHCCFCSKSQHEVLILIVGNHETICNECVEICTEILEEKRTKSTM